MTTDQGDDHRPTQDMTKARDPENDHKGTNSGNDDRPTQDMITDYDIGNDHRLRR